MTRMIVKWGSNPINVYVAGNEFGATHVILAHSFEEAWEEWADGQEACDHGNDPEVLAKIEAGDDDIGCDCRMTDQGVYVWDVYLWIREHGRLDNFLAVVCADSKPVA